MLRGILWLGSGSAIVVVMIAVAPFFLKSREATDRVEAINNIIQTGLSLQEFDSEYGAFPSASTASLVKAKTGTPLALGSSSSNQLVRQLIAQGLKSEKPFYAKSAHSHRVDDDFSDDAHALAPGECAFAYVTGLSSSVDPETPVLMTPMIPGTTSFDSRIYNGKAIILRANNSVTPLPIDAAGHAIEASGRDIFDPRQPYRHGKAPVIVWPE